MPGRAWYWNIQSWACATGWMVLEKRRKYDSRSISTRLKMKTVFYDERALSLIVFKFLILEMSPQRCPARQLSHFESSGRARGDVHGLPYSESRHWNLLSRQRHSVAATARRVRFGNGCIQGFEFGDLDAKFARAFDKVFPGECRRPLCGELVVERDGIMVVQQNEMVADRQAEPCFDDQADRKSVV